MAYPSSTDAFLGTTAQGTSLLSSPDHALDHRTLGSAVAGIETVLGTNSGTSVLKNFTDGDFAIRGTTDGVVNTDGTLTDNSDSYIPTQKAVKTYVDNTATSIAGSINTSIGNNFLINSGFGLCASWGTIARGTAVSCTSYTIGGNSVRVTTTNTQGLVAGKLIGVTAGADASLTRTAHLVTAVTENTYVTFKLDADTIAAGAGGTIQIQEVVPGSEAADGNGPNGWSKSTNLTAWRQQDTYVKDGSFYSLGLKKRTTADSVLYQKLAQDSGDPNNDATYNLAKWAGREIVFGCWVYPRGGASIRAFIRDDSGYTYSNYATVNQWNWLEVTATVSSYSSLTFLWVGVYFEGAFDDSCYVSQPRLDYGSALGEGNYIEPRDEWVITKAHITPSNYSGGTSTITSPRFFEMEGETNGIIPKTAKEFKFALEADTDTAGNGIVLHNRAYYGGENIKVYCPFDASIHDYSEFLRAATAQGTAAISSSAYKIGTASLSLNGSSKSIYFADSDDFYFGNNPFSIDMYINFNALPSSGNYMWFYSQYSADPTRLIFGIYNTGSQYNLIAYNGTVAVAACNQISPGTASWHHYGLFRGWGNLYNSWTITYDGSSKTTTVSTSTVPNISANAYIGQYGDSSGWLNAYVDELIISKGVSRYTADFTPSTTALAAGAIIYSGILFAPVADRRVSQQFDVPIRDGGFMFGVGSDGAYGRPTDTFDTVAIDGQAVKVS